MVQKTELTTPNCSWTKTGLLRAWTEHTGSQPSVETFDKWLEFCGIGVVVRSVVTGLGTPRNVPHASLTPSDAAFPPVPVPQPSTVAEGGVGLPSFPHDLPGPVDFPGCALIPTFPTSQSPS